MLFCFLDIILTFIVEYVTGDNALNTNLNYGQRGYVHSKATCTLDSMMRLGVIGTIRCLQVQIMRILIWIDHKGTVTYKKLKAELTCGLVVCHAIISPEKQWFYDRGQSEEYKTN